MIKGLSYLREKHKIMHRGQSVWFNQSVFMSQSYLIIDVKTDLQVWRYCWKGRGRQHSVHRGSCLLPVGSSCHGVQNALNPSFRRQAVKYPGELPLWDQAVRFRSERTAHRLHGQLLCGHAVLHVCELKQTWSSLPELVLCMHMHAGFSAANSH